MLPKDPTVREQKSSMRLVAILVRGIWPYFTTVPHLGSWTGGEAVFQR